MAELCSTRRVSLSGVLAILFLAGVAGPAAAQELPAVHEPSFATAPATPGGFSQAQGKPAEDTLARLPTGRTRFEAGATRPGRNSPLSDVVHFDTTPFATEVSLPLLQVGRGRVQISGFSDKESMENFLWGLPGSGSLPAWSATGGPSHISVLAPQGGESYGVALTFHGASRVLTGASLPRLLVSRLVHTSAS